MPGPRTRALLSCLLALALAEWGLREVERRLAPTGGLPVGRPLYVALGTSRTQRGVVPEVVEAALARAGVRDPWVANVSQNGTTHIGLLQLYMQDIHPRMDGSLDPRVLAIEVRSAGLNDRVQATAREERFLSRNRLDVAPGQGGPRLDPEAWATGLLGHLALARAAEIRARWQAPARFSTEDWQEGHRGWEPWEGTRPEDLRREAWAKRYRGQLLADLEVGGVQLAALRRLVRRARDDGWTVVLVRAPVTEVHRGFWEPADRVLVDAALRRVTEEEGLTLLDYEADHGVPEEEFWDTHHLATPGARRFSRTLGAALARLP